MARNNRPDDIAREMAGEPPEPLYTRRRGVGTIKYWRQDKGYGAIACADTAPWDIWCHLAHLEVAGGIATLPSGEQVPVTFDENGRAQGPNGEEVVGMIQPFGRLSVQPGDQVDVLYHRVDRESFKYVAIHVRRPTPPPDARWQLTENDVGMEG